MSPSLFDADVLVLRRDRKRLAHGIRLEVCDRGGTVLATVTEPRKRSRLFGLDGFGDARTTAREVLISRPDGAPLALLHKQWNALRRPTQIWDARGEPLGGIRVTSWSTASWTFDITDPHGHTVGGVAGTARAFTVTDGGGQTVADIFKEGDSQVLVFRAEPPEPLRTLAVAALVNTRLVLWGARIADFV
ncbi:MAG TPA: hypothetical protein VFU43_16595 [Streptosporangiaceae bacterium]|nr:hypothetical protein [Streptosporangiaceae bacterium]